eukprot:TRINITY_DN6538_c0_g1_i4.p2 TRINITY_DN6538_c0_g1~~TRINITY_DN6538_c0_g1_i4.p2  ORF type:complete len:104 (-),score=22.26 TRINITY_DN6538_c0_g1_i4:187-498(-)
MIRRPPRSTQGVSSAASDVYKRQLLESQNHSLQKELDNFVATDEKVKTELNRKSHVDHMKAKIEEELSNSFSKSSSSVSPVKNSVPELSLFQSPISSYSRKAY